ncbi:MAG: M23 family metallopeptidase [Parcubacteria group bacterium]|jgi:hypothetical protein
MREVRPIYIILFVLAVTAGIFFTVINKKSVTVSQPTLVAVQNNQSSEAPAPQNSSAPIQEALVNNPNITPDFQPPLDRAGERLTKKPFGIFITPQNSPVQPEKFTGYHTGADFEIFPEELGADVAVHAVCSGKLLSKKYASGYGGVMVQACMLENNPITVIYGHLKLASIATATGSNLNIGDTIGILGAAYSQETNGERKHLHLGFHKGTAVSILGYVQNKADLSEWVDPCLYVCYD